jgi:hypothetical protein
MLRLMFPEAAQSYHISPLLHTAMFCMLFLFIGVQNAGNSKPHPDADGSGGWGEILVGKSVRTCL